MKTHRDVVIVGAGPAGLSAAIEAGKYGLDVMVLDEQPTPGGQLYRNIEQAPNERLSLLGSDYQQGLNLINRFRASGVDYVGNAVVWKIESKGSIFFSRHGKSTEISAKAIVIAIGATERPVPFLGWDLPGVMGAGAMDANFKSSGIIPTGPVVLAGSGPLLFLAAGHLISLGVQISAILDTTQRGAMLSSLRHLPKALMRTNYLLKGIGMLAKLQKSGVPWVRGVTKYSAEGRDCVESVYYRTLSKSGRIFAQVLLTHEGVIPRCDFTLQMQLPHLWNPVQHYWYPQTDIFGKTHEDRIYVCGDGAFVHGGIPAALKGALAVLDIAERLKVLDTKQKEDASRIVSKELSWELAPRQFVDAMYRPRSSMYAIEDEVLVCRCEGVRMKEIRAAVVEGSRDANVIKALTRCGMGPCQSRMCGIALEAIIADHLGEDPDKIPPVHIRPPVRNLTFSDLAQVELINCEVSEDTKYYWH